MRKFLVFILLLAVVLIGYYFLTKEKIIQIPEVFQTPIPSLLPTKQTLVQINYQDKIYIASVLKVPNPDRLVLYPNFSEPDTALNLKEKYHCSALFNGGFYTPSQEPTGLFISEGKTIKQANANSTYDGYIIEDGEKVYIGSVPQNDAFWAVQTGPRLFINGQKRKLSLVRDKYARRIVALNTSKNEFYVVALYTKENEFDGPQLVDLPEIVDLVSKELSITVKDAINLDGGSASAFVTSNVSLTELTPIGSFFCVK